MERVEEIKRENGRKEKEKWIIQMENRKVRKRS
jgi:hypothetical protein